MKMINWGILGLGTIAHEFAENMNGLHPIYGAAARNPEAARAFQKEFNVLHCYDSYEALLSDPAIDIVYIAVVNSQHYKWIMAALEQGKHVLCEKAIWGNYDEMKKAQKLAEEKGLLLAEAMTIYHMPLYTKVRSLISDGVLGRIKYVEAELGSLKPDDPANRFFNPDLGGGAMLDIGTYVLSFVTFFLQGSITDLTHLMQPYPTGVDEMWHIDLKTDAGELGSAGITFRAKLPKRGIIAGEKAYLSIMNYVRAQEARLIFPDGREEVICAGDTQKALQYEILDIESALQSKDYTRAYLKQTMEVVRLMDQLMRSEGL